MRSAPPGSVRASAWASALVAALLLSGAPAIAAQPAAATIAQPARAPERGWVKRGRILRAALGKAPYQKAFHSPTLARQWEEAMPPEQAASLLRDIVARVRARAASAPAGHKPYVVFDLDDTVLDGRPRIARAAQHAGLPDPTDPAASDLAAVYGKLPRTGWRGLLNEAKLRVFSDEYYNARALRMMSVAMPGARELVHAIEQAGGEVVYHTARGDSMRDETLELLQHVGLPLHDPMRNLVMGDRTGSKLAAAQRLAAERGEPVAAFDNEPHNTIAFRKAFRSAYVLRLAGVAFTGATEPPPPGVWIISSLAL